MGWENLCLYLDVFKGLKVVELSIGVQMLDGRDGEVGVEGLSFLDVPLDSFWYNLENTLHFAS